MLLTLPPELLAVVLSHLKVDDLRAVAQTCQTLRGVRWSTINLCNANLPSTWFGQTSNAGAPEPLNSLVSLLGRRPTTVVLPQCISLPGSSLSSTTTTTTNTPAIGYERWVQTAASFYCSSMLGQVIALRGLRSLDFGKAAKLGMAEVGVLAAILAGKSMTENNAGTAGTAGTARTAETGTAGAGAGASAAAGSAGSAGSAAAAAANNTDNNNKCGLVRLRIGGDETAQGTLRRKAVAVAMTELLVTDGLRQCASLRSVEMHWALGAGGGHAIGMLLKPGGPPLTKLVLECCELGADGVAALAAIIAGGGGSTLQSLRIREGGTKARGACGDAGVVKLFNALGTARKALHCWDRTSTSTSTSTHDGQHPDQQEFSGVVPGMPAAGVKGGSLGLEGCAVRKDGAAALGALLLSGFQLRTINLCGNKLGHAGVAALCTAVASSPCVRVLDLSQTELTDQDAEQLATVVAAAQLQVLKCGYNKIRCTGAECFARGLLTRSRRTNAANGQSDTRVALFELDLRANFVQKRGVEALLAVLEEVRSLRKLDLRDCAGGIGALDANYPTDKALLSRLVGFPLDGGQSRERKRPKRIRNGALP